MIKACLIVCFLHVVAFAARTDFPYEGVGAFRTKKQSFAFTAPLETGCVGEVCDVRITATMPVSASNETFPVGMFFHGFQLASRAYRSTIDRLATHGYVALAWDTNEGVFTATEHGTLAKMAQMVYDVAVNEGTLPIDENAAGYVVSGHSLGGKIAGLLAQRDERVKAAVLIDPVDCDPPFTDVEAGDWPKVLDQPEALSVPAAIVSSELGSQRMFGMACAPAKCSHDAMYDAIEQVTWDVTVLDAGHNDFTDSRNLGIDAACVKGEAIRTEVLSVAQTVLVAWAEAAIRGEDISAYQTVWVESLGDSVISRLKSS